MEIFQYGEKEINHLKNKDKRLAAAIERIGAIEREVHPDLFAALVQSIVGQQISTKAQMTIWRRMKEGFGEITPENIYAAAEEDLQGYGISFRKAHYIHAAAEKVLAGDLDLSALYDMPDDEVCASLSKLEGIGVWTAEMLLIFSMQRQDVLSFGDLAILRGMRMLYHHRQITRPLFEKYRRRYAPYGSVASLYLWEIAGGAIADMKDYAPKTVRAKKTEKPEKRPKASTASKKVIKK